MTTDPVPTTLRVAAEITEPAQDFASASPGRQIRMAREGARLSIEELATQTRLAKSTLEALERDDFGALNEAVYVRGYYRKCAKILNLNEPELIAAYDRLFAPKTPIAPTKLLLGSGDTIGPSRHRTGLPGLLPILAIAVAIGVGAWLLMNDPGDFGFGAGTAQPPIPASVQTPAQAPAPTDPLPQTLSISPELSSPAPASDAASSLTGTAEASAAPSLNLAPSPTLAVSPPPVVPAGPGSLVLTFKSNSWVRIEDADGRQLLSGVIQAGARQQLSGRAPYSLFIGYAPGVAIEYDGKPVDIGPLVRENSTARFKLPLAAAP